jgi:hypothetical protein
MEIIDSEITNTQLVDGLFTGHDIGTWQADYLLREVEFERIKHGKPITYNWANSIGLTTVGFGLNLLGKGYSDVALIGKGEWVALSSGAIVTLVLYFIGLCIKDSRKVVMKKIGKHFENAPTRRQLFGGEE